VISKSSAYLDWCCYAGSRSVIRRRKNMNTCTECFVARHLNFQAEASSNMDLVITPFNKHHYGPATKEPNIAYCILMSFELKLAWRHNKAKVDKRITNYDPQCEIYYLYVKSYIYASTCTVTATYDAGRPGSLLRVSDGGKITMWWRNYRQNKGRSWLVHCSNVRTYQVRNRNLYIANVRTWWSY
jgi:hypothetical protein